MPIQHILFDADEVLQTASHPWRAALVEALDLGEACDADRLLTEVMSAEQAALTSPTSGFVVHLEQVLSGWGRAAGVSEALEVMLSIDVHDDTMRLVQTLRRGGIGCHIGSNQQALRARHMSNALNYCALFDREFYSCFVGAAKPQSLFFERVLAQLDSRAESVLFIDDNADNVDAARRCGLPAFVFRHTEGLAVLQQRLVEHGLPLALAERFQRSQRNGQLASNLS